MEDNEVLFRFTKSYIENSQFEEHIYFDRPEFLSIVEQGSEAMVCPKGLKYFKKPNPYLYPLDLNIGFESYIFRQNLYYKSNMHKTEFYIMNNDAKVLTYGNEERTQIFTHRGVLSEIMQIPYYFKQSESKENIRIHATKFKDVLYLSLDKYQRGPNVRTNRNDTYHFKFKQYCFVDTPGTGPDIDTPVDENKQQYCIFRSKLKDFDMVYSAEVDGVLSDKKLEDMTNLNELNKYKFVYTKLLPDYMQWKNWKGSDRTLKFWIKSYLSNVDHMFIAFKSREGLVRREGESIKAAQLARNQQWKPYECNWALHEFLNVIKNKMSAINCPYSVYEFNFSYSSGCISAKYYPGKTPKSFLSEQFVEYLKKF